MKNILAVLPGPGQHHLEKMVEAAHGNNIIFKAPSDVTQDDVDSANVLVGLVPVSFLHGQSSIEFMQLTSAGADAYVKEGLLSRSTVLSCCTGAYSQSVSEHAFAVTLMLLKKLHLYRDDQSECCWADEGTTGTLNGATVLVMGLGDIGRCYAKLVKTMGAHVIGIKRRPGEKPDFVDELYTTDDFDCVVPRADIIFSVLPGSPATEHFFTLERFRLMKESAIFINCGRGNAVDGDVLYKVLSENIISCAGVDVFENEPLDKSSPLWGLKNLVITPHASGFFHLPVTKDRVIDICAQNLAAWLDGREIINIVDYETGYKI